MRKIYGNIENRDCENKIYKENKLIEVNDDATEYLWSDRKAWYVTKVIDQKHIFIKKYKVVAGKDAYGMGHQSWEYIKDENQPELELRFLYGKWKIVNRDSNGEVIKYKNFGNISFGIRDYYYDWEF